VCVCLTEAEGWREEEGSLASFFDGVFSLTLLFCVRNCVDGWFSLSLSLCVCVCVCVCFCFLHWTGKVGKGKNSRGKAGGRTRGPKGSRDKPRKLDKTSLDDDLDAYMLKDKKAGTTKLNEDLDDYFKQGKEKKEQEVKEKEDEATEAK